MCSSDLAAQALGGVPVPLYQDAIAQEMMFVLDNAEIAFAIVEDQEQVDKLLESSAAIPRLTHIFYDDPRGLRNYTDPRLMPLKRLLELGRDYDQAHPGFYDESIAAARALGRRALLMIRTDVGSTTSRVLPEGVMAVD